MEAILFLVFALYALPLLLFAFAANMQRTFNNVQVRPHIGISVVVCARNESENIDGCLESILSQEYPKEQMEIIFIDDASDDSTFEKTQKLLTESGVSHRLIRNKQRVGKKKSLADAIPACKHEVVISRDADTLSENPNWLNTIASAFEKGKADFVIGEVTIRNEDGFLNALQSIENQVLLLLSCGSSFLGQAFLCSGANLAFRKSVFLQTNGYASHLEIESGDDVLFLAEVKKIKNVKIFFLKNADAAVSTKAMTSFKTLFRQKLRWISKTAKNPDLLSRFMALVIGGCNLAFVIALVCWLFFQVQYFLIFMALKCGLDILLLFLARDFMPGKKTLFYSLPVALTYPFYSTLIAIGSVFYKPSWK